MIFCKLSCAGAGARSRFWLPTLLPFVLSPNYLMLASQIAITALFALSLDLILGFAGIVSLGHAAFFGVGAYAAGLLSVWGWGEPLTGLVDRGPSPPACSAMLTSFVIARFRHLALIMITLGIGLLLQEAANSASWLTGGFDGLQGIDTWPILGKLRFRSLRLRRLQLFARRAVRAVSRRAAAHSFAVRAGAARHPRERRRMPAIGAPSRAHIRTIYTIAAAIAGIAGALLAQTTETLSLEFARLPALGRSAGHARSSAAPAGCMAGWSAPSSTWSRGTSSPGIEPAILVFLDRPALDAVVMFLPNGILGGLCAARRTRWEPRVSAGALHARPRQEASARWWSPPTSTSTCRRACATR